jgi:hypothetical protein
MAFDFTDSWNPANDPKQSPWGSYSQRFAGDKYGDLSKNFKPESNISINQGKKTESGEDLSMVSGEPSKVVDGGNGGTPWGQILSTAASIGISALSGGFGGAGGGGGAGNFSSAFSSSGPTFNPGVAFSKQSFL